MVWLLLQTMRVLDWGSPGPGGECREEALESALKSLQQCRLDPRELPRPHRHLDSCGRSRSTSCLSHIEYRQHSKTRDRAEIGPTLVTDLDLLVPLGCGCV